MPTDMQPLRYVVLLLDYYSMLGLFQTGFANVGALLSGSNSSGIITSSGFG